MFYINLADEGSVGAEVDWVPNPIEGELVERAAMRECGAEGFYPGVVDGEFGGC